MAGAGVPASIADRAAIVAALQVLCALPETVRQRCPERARVFCRVPPPPELSELGGVGNAVSCDPPPEALRPSLEQLDMLQARGCSLRLLDQQELLHPVLVLAEPLSGAPFAASARATFRSPPSDAERMAAASLFLRTGVPAGTCA